MNDHQKHGKHAKGTLRLNSYTTALLGVLAFWAGMLTAERCYPGEFDGRYMMLSALLSPRRNPSGYLWAGGGIIISALCVLAWAVSLLIIQREENVDDESPGTWLIALGSACMACSIMLLWHLPTFPKEHEVFTVLAFASLCLGIARMAFQTAEQAFRLRAGAATKHARRYGAGFAAVAVLPILMAGFAEAYVFYALPGLHWVDLTWRTRGVPVYLSFAFWEWVTCAVLSVYMLILSLAAQENGRVMRTRDQAALAFDSNNLGHPRDRIVQE
jgi:hypothetical protein